MNIQDWLITYKTSMDGRYETFYTAFELLQQLPNHNIIETGCVRMKDDWGAGYSTVLFGEFCKIYGGKVITIDNSENHMNICKKLTENLSNNIIYIVNDSLLELEHTSFKIDLLYLDSMDIDLNGDRLPSQIHNLLEFKVAEKFLHDKSIVLIDDYFDGNGKGKLTQIYMLNTGWSLIKCKQQQLFVKNND